MSPRPQRSRAPRGMALLSMIVLLFFVLGITLLGTLGRTSSVSVNADASLNQIELQADVQAARDLAETGIRITYSWMLEQETINNLNLPFAPSEQGSDFYGATVESGYNVIPLSQAPTAIENPMGKSKPSRLRVRIYPGNDPSTGQKVFAIQSIGECGTRSYTSRLVLRPKGFAEYGLFYDEPLDNFVWMAGMHVFSGPVHLNMRLVGTNTVDTTAVHTIVWDTRDALFTYPESDYFSCAGTPSQIEWWNGLVTLQEPTTTDWPFVATAGTAPKFNAPLIPFPTDTTYLHDAALGGVMAPTAPGVLVPSASGSTVGGIYVAGSVKSLDLSTSGTNNINQVLDFQQTDGATLLRTLVTLDRINNRTMVERYSSTTLTATEVFTGVTSGLVYVDGDIGDTATKTGGLSGTVANSSSADVLNRLTVATPADRRVQIKGGIVYQRLAKGDPVNLESDAAEADALCGIFGLITGRMWVIDNDKDGKHIDNITIHAALLALDSSGGVPSVGCTDYDKRKSGTYRHLGALIIKKDGPFGQFHYDSTTGALLDQFGFSRKRLYDQRLLELAPVYFPLTTKTYKVLSFESGVAPLP